MDDHSDHAGAPVTDNAVTAPRNSIMAAHKDDTDDMSNYDDAAVVDSAAAGSAQEELSSLDARRVRVKGREVSCVDNG